MLMVVGIGHRKSPAGESHGALMSSGKWLRGLDLNQRPSGYEPDELPDCSTPRYRMCVVWMVSRDEKAAARCAPAAAFLKS